MEPSSKMLTTCTSLLIFANPPAEATPGRAAMQTVWSRVAQTRCLCNCPSCLSATNLVIRRTTTATARRKVRVGDAFTVFASSLAATATFIDSTRKDARRWQWDRVIAEAKAQVEATETEQQSRLKALAHVTEEGNLEEYGATEPDSLSGYLIGKGKDGHFSLGSSRTKVYTWTDVFTWAGQQDTARAASGFQGWQGPSLSLLQSLSPKQLQQLQSDDTLLRRFYGGPGSAASVEESCTNYLSAKKTRTLEYSVAKLVLNMLLCSQDSSQKSENKAGFPSESGLLTRDKVTGENNSKDRALLSQPYRIRRVEKLPRKKSDARVSIGQKKLLQDDLQDQEDLRRRLNDIDSQIRALRRLNEDANSQSFEKFLPPLVPSYCGSPSTGPGEVKALNKSIHHILDKMTTANDSTLSISRICFNLLMSRAPPDIHSYNMMLVRFCHLDRNDLVQAVLTSMRECHVRPNEITHATLLRYFTVANSPSAFTKYLLRMLGFNGGLGIAAPGQIISPIAAHRYRLFGRNKRKAAQIARMNGEVYESLILGALRFLGVHTAMQYYCDMISEGWKASVTLLTAILKHCQQKIDWEAGLSVWEQITATIEGPCRMSYEWMLCLCQASRQDHVYDQILRDAVDQGAFPSWMLEVPHSVRHQSFSIHDKDVNSTSFHPDKYLSKHISASQEKDPVKPLKTSTSEATSDPLSSFDKNKIHAKTAPVGTSATDAHRKRQSLEGKIETLARDISQTAVQLKSQHVHPKAAQLDQSDMVHSLSLKLRKLNESDLQKVNGKDYEEYRNGLRHRSQKNWEVNSRNLYERYSRDVISKLERNDLSDGPTHSDGNSLHERRPAKPIESRKLDPVRMEYLAGLLYDRPPVSTPSNMPNPASWGDVDDSPISVSAHLHG